MTYQPGFDATRVECKSGGLWSKNNFARCAACQARDNYLSILNNLASTRLKTRNFGKRYLKSLEIYQHSDEEPQIITSPVFLAEP